MTHGRAERWLGNRDAEVGAGSGGCRPPSARPEASPMSRKMLKHFYFRRSVMATTSMTTVCRLIQGGGRWHRRV